MFLLSIAGMKVADNGMNEMKGNNHSTLPTNISFQNKDWQNLIGDDHLSHNIKAKEQKLEKINSFNLFSWMGKELAEGITSVSRNMIKLVIK
jgi:hypothetical protein